MTATVEHPDGRTETLPIFAVRGLATHPDAAVREAAFRAELDGLAGQRHARSPPPSTPSRARRWRSAPDAGWDDPLAPVLEASAVERAAFDAMQARGRRLAPRLPPLPGRPRPGCSARTAAPSGTCSPPSATPPRSPGPTPRPRSSGPSPATATTWSGWPAGRSRERWVDAGPRAGKVGGAFCMHVGRRRQPRPHELRRLASTRCTRSPTSWATPTTTRRWRTRTPLQRSTPMALAETASIFCETILTDRALERRRGRRAPGPARGRPAGRVPGGGRHPQPVPVRVAAVRPAGGVDGAGPRAVRADARGPGRGVRRRPRPRRAATR